MIQEIERKNIQYSGPQVDGTTTTVNYSATYSGTYDRVDQEDTFVQYDGVRQISYDGSRNSYQLGSNVFWAGSRQIDVDNPSTIQYTGTFTGQRDNPALTPTTLLGEDSYTVIKTYIGYYTGQRTFTGERVNYKLVGRTGFFTGTYTMIDPTRQSYYGGFLGMDKYTSRSKTYIDYFAGLRPFTGDRNFDGDRDFSTQYQGYFTNYLTTYDVTQVNRQFTGDRNFDGQRDTTEFFSGQRTFSDNYIGPRYFDGNYVGPTSVQRSSTIQVPYNGSYTGDYIGYSSASFTQQFGANYNGNTITNPTELINSYTLWVKKSE